MAKSARDTAVTALLKIEEENAYSNIIIDAEIAKNRLQGHDAAFASRLFYGVLERMLTLDACILNNTTTPWHKISSTVRVILRVGLYQLLYMDGVPDAAAVNECVKMARRYRVASAAGFINAVLRSFIRKEKEIPLPKDDLAAQWSIQYSIPKEFVLFWTKHYGKEETEVFLQNALRPAPIYIKVNTVKITPDALLKQLQDAGITAQRYLLDDCILLKKPGAITELEAYQKGYFHVQDISSQLCVKALQAQQGHNVADVCAAPGGKTFTIAENMCNIGKVHAFDLYENRVGLIKKGAQRLGLSIVTATTHDATAEMAPALGKFDRILCDVPCSGLGIIRRKPEIKYKKLDNFKNLPEMQYKILQKSAQYLKKDGILVYSTCTLNPNENEKVVKKFLQNHPAFVGHCLPDVLQTNCYYKTLLNAFDGDGFFIAAVKRVEE